MKTISREAALSPFRYPETYEGKITEGSKGTPSYDFILRTSRVSIGEKLLRGAVSRGSDGYHTETWRTLLLEEMYEYMLEFGPGQLDLLERYNFFKELGDKDSLSAFLKIFSIEQRHIRRWTEDGENGEGGSFPIEDDVWMPGAGIPTVYYLSDDDYNTVYIGQSVNLRSRLRQHAKSPEKTTLATEWTYVTCPNIIQMNVLESSEISKVRPVLNRAGVTSPIFPGMHRLVGANA
jgi:hypothetical protein